MNEKSDHDLYTIENTIVLETLSYLENKSHHFLRKTSPLLKDYMKLINMEIYKLEKLDIEELTEVFDYLDNQVVEKIFIQCYSLMLKWNKTSQKYDKRFIEVFSSLGSYRIKELMSLVTQYNDNEINIEKLLTPSDSEVLKPSVKIRAVKLFERLKSSNEKEVDHNKLTALNKGALKKVWVQVNKILEIVNNPSTPKHIKAIAIGAIIYVVAPVDAIPDIIPVGGLVDDAAIVLLALEQIKALLNKR